MNRIHAPGADMRTRTIAVAILAVLVQSLGSVTPARAADPVTVVFAFSGEEQVFDVPDAVSSITVDLIGAGGGGNGVGDAGGRGARVTGDLSVSPGTRLYIAVGGAGFGDGYNNGVAGFNGGGDGGFGLTDGGFENGGGGGGASDIRTVSRSAPGSLSSRVIVAAGGGGAGGRSAGGDAGQAGVGGAYGGGAGTATAGGAGGQLSPGPAAPGTLGLGGAGGAVCNTDICTSGQGGGGGGGGLYGGGGGGAGLAADGGGGGGGGGSSFTGTAANTSVAVDASGTPSVSITYDPNSREAGGTVDAVVTVPTSAACLELSTTSIEFGLVALGAVDAPAAPTIGVTNCSGSAGIVYARGTDAAGPNAAWGLVDSSATCADTLGVDAYHLRLASDGTVQLSTENKSIGSVASGATTNQIARIDAACPGSTGGGTTMTFEILFLATEG